MIAAHPVHDAAVRAPSGRPRRGPALAWSLAGALLVAVGTAVAGAADAVSVADLPEEARAALTALEAADDRATHLVMSIPDALLRPMWLGPGSVKLPDVRSSMVSRLDFLYAPLRSPLEIDDTATTGTLPDGEPFAVVPTCANAAEPSDGDVRFCFDLVLVRHAGEWVVLTSDDSAAALNAFFQPAIVVDFNDSIRIESSAWRETEPVPAIARLAEALADPQSRGEVVADGRPAKLVEVWTDWIARPVLNGVAVETGLEGEALAERVRQFLRLRETGPARPWTFDLAAARELTTDDGRTVVAVPTIEQGEFRGQRLTSTFDTVFVEEGEGWTVSPLIDRTELSHLRTAYDDTFPATYLVTSAVEPRAE